ncbi:MAG: hypothetical protein ACYDEP_06260 [Acidimicrobiales bacterium]
MSGGRGVRETVLKSHVTRPEELVTKYVGRHLAAGTALAAAG